jgi:hypothetical protein
MQKKTLILSLLISGFSVTAFTQKDSAVYFKGAIRENRDMLHRNIIQNTITRNLSLPLNDDTEENWADAFGGMELLHYKSPWADSKINLAFDSIQNRSTGFQRALLELAYTSYPDRFIKQVTSLLNKCMDAKVFAMSAEYMMLNNEHPFTGINLENKKQQLVRSEKDEAITRQLFYRIQNPPHQKNDIPVTGIISRDFLKNHTILYSFQRKNRNYPGLAVIRDATGNFIKAEDGTIFFVPQLARSINNLPGYLTNGNTPQGIFRMYGFDTSKTYFIGPTANIQLTMPFETSLRHFFNDSTITDTIWTEEWYKKLLPANLKNCRPLYESFYAGKAGRTEIIAHGTTVDPEYYSGEIYYPQTPTMGCLCTKEIWSDVNGKRLESDQQKLATALQAAGGADGYCVVLEIDDAQKPVTLNEILSLLKSLTTK